MTSSGFYPTSEKLEEKLPPLKLRESFSNLVFNFEIVGDKNHFFKNNMEKNHSEQKEKVCFTYIFLSKINVLNNLEHI